MQPHERTIRKESQHVLPPFSDDLPFEELLSNNNNVNPPPSNNNNNMLNSRTLSNPRFQHSTVTSHSSSSTSLNNSRNNLIEKNNSMMINNNPSAPTSSSSSSASTSGTTLIPIGGVGSGIAIIPGNQVLASTTQSNNHSLPEKIVGGASKCPICTRNKQSCEESKELMGKIGVSYPFLKSENDTFNNRITRNKGKIKMKEFNSSIRAEFKNFMKKISSEIFKSEEEYSAFLKKNYYDVLNQMLNNVIKNNPIDDDEEYQSDPSDDEEELSTEEDDNSDSDTTEEDTDDEDSIRKKRKTKLSTPSSKKSKLDKSPAATSRSNGSSSSSVPSSSSSSNIVPLAEAKVELLAYQEKYKSLNIHMLCILNLSDFDSLEKFKAKIKKQLNITKDDFKIYFQLEKLQGREFIVGNPSALNNLKQQIIGCPVTKRQIIEIRGM